MQKSLLFFALVMLFNFSVAFAGTDNRSLEITRKLSQELQLNESTFIKVKLLNDQRFKELDEAITKFGNNPELKQAKVKEIDSKFYKEVESVLNTNQKVVFHNLVLQNNSYMAIEK